VTLDAPPFVQDLPVAREAFQFAQARHASQQRESDGAPFILHPLEVASLLHASGWGDEVVATAMLHDLLEDTDAAGEELRERFGERVAGLVAALTEDESIEDYVERKAALRRQAVGAGEEARAVFAADKVAKVRELRAQIAWSPTPGDASRERRLAHYEACLVALERYDPEATLVRKLRFELWALRSLPPRDAGAPS
jgi:(p)ppGpp synthase/HD superfamily hydrolase